MFSVLPLCVIGSKTIAVILYKFVNPLDPKEISENPSEILGKSPFLTKYGSIWFFHNNLFNIEYLPLQVTFILINIELPTKWYMTRQYILHTYYWYVISLPALQRSFI